MSICSVTKAIINSVEPVMWKLRSSLPIHSVLAISFLQLPGSSQTVCFLWVWFRRCKSERIKITAFLHCGCFSDKTGAPYKNTISPSLYVMQTLKTLIILFLLGGLFYTLFLHTWSFNYHKPIREFSTVSCNSCV